MDAETWHKMLLEAPKDSWIAFSEDETTIVAHGSTYEEAVTKAEKNGVKDPVLVKTPKDWVKMILAS